MKIARIREAASALLAIAAVASSGCCSVAVALEPGVHADPGSPAAKEYALPLTQARQTGQGSRPGSSGALFGAGIVPKRSPSVSVHGSRRASPMGRAHKVGPLGALSGVSNSSASGGLARQALPGGGGSSSTLALLGGGVFVLVVGAFLGVVLRGRRTIHSN